MKKIILLIGVLFIVFCITINSYAKEALLQTTANPNIKQGYVNTPDGQIHYWEAGSGPVLFLIHQSSSSAEEYAGLVPYLAGSYRLVTFDWPGYGASDDPPQELGVEGFTKSATAVLDHLEIDKMHLLGHHGGALIAMNLAWTQPERINKLMLSGTSGVKKKAETKDFAKKLDVKKRNFLDAEGKSLSEAWGRYRTYMPNSAPEEILVPYLNNVMTRLRPYNALNSVLRWDRKPALASFKDKTILLMQGENDSYVTQQETLLEILPKAKRVVVQDAGTFMFFENPQAAAEVISDFLKK